ncbi:MAG: hypothetical protein H7138_07370, partial [Myxococcales bacterium]|nr:hypothetical protein [Myxococcales bacterium]
SRGPRGGELAGAGSGRGGGGGGGRRELGDRKALYKLVAGKPRMVLVKPGLTDGSSTQLLEGDLAPGDLLVTEIIGAPSGPTRKVGAF